MNANPLFDLRVLSIQSHVVSGYVGNKCATFTMQVHGFDVDTIDTVQFSNHTGYPLFKGQVLRVDNLREVYQGLKLNNLTNYSHILTGYICDQLVLGEIGKIVQEIQQRNPKVIYVCDPVMGDCGKFYVSEKLASIYKERLLPFANVITPNQFELEVLSGSKVHCERDIVSAISSLFTDRLRMIVVTSLDNDAQSDRLCGYFAQRRDDSSEAYYKFEVQRFNERFVGTGDLFSSLLLVWLQKTDGCLLTSVRNAQSSIQYILKQVMANAGEFTKRGSTKANSLELRVIHYVDALKTPEPCVNIIPLDLKH